MVIPEKDQIETKLNAISDQDDNSEAAGEVNSEILQNQFQEAFDNRK